MNLLDTNVWLAITLSRHQFHSAARNWFKTETRHASIIVCRATQQSFLRILTTTSFMQLYGEPPLSNTNAWQVMQHNLADPRFLFVPEPSRLQTHWENLALRQTSSPKIWMDAYLAAFAIAGKYKLITTDKAFAQFKGLSHLLLSNAAST